MRSERKWQIILLLLILPAGAVFAFDWQDVQSPSAGCCQLWGYPESDQYWFWAVECSIDSAVAKISRATGIPLTAETLPQGKILNCRYGPVSISQLLDRLGLAYGLTYEETAAGELITSGSLLYGIGRLPLPSAQVRKIRSLIQDLYDDDVRFNAENAKAELYVLGELAVPFLEQAVLNGDCQARNFAGMILTWRDDYTNPPPGVLQYYFSALAGDDTLYGQPCDFADNEDWAVRFFENRPQLIDQIVPQLAGGLTSTDGQMRFVSAYLLSINKHWEYAAQMAPIFAMHLKDNKLGGDATIAAYALTAMGNTARPWVLPLTKSEDSQEQAYAELILYHIDNPAAPPRKSGLHPVIHDPAIQRRRLYMGRWTPQRFPDMQGNYQNED